MNTIIRAHGRISIGIAWMLTCMGVLAIIAVIVLSLLIESWMIVFLFGPVLLFIGAGVNFWMGTRARLKITPEHFIWAGFVGRPRTIDWQDVDRILVPAPGSRRRLAAVARLRDGRFVEIDALWQSPTTPSTHLSAPDHSRAQRALIDGHLAYLARVSHRPQR